MTHETGQQRYRRLKRDPLRHQVLAPSYTVPPVRCLHCGHAQLMHQGLECLSYGCGCEGWNEEVT